MVPLDDRGDIKNGIDTTNGSTLIRNNVSYPPIPFIREEGQGTKTIPLF